MLLSRARGEQRPPRRRAEAARHERAAPPPHPLTSRPPPRRHSHASRLLRWSGRRLAASASPAGVDLPRLLLRSSRSRRRHRRLPPRRAMRSTKRRTTPPLRSSPPTLAAASADPALLDSPRRTPLLKAPLLTAGCGCRRLPSIASMKRRTPAPTRSAPRRIDVDVGCPVTARASTGAASVIMVGGDDARCLPGRLLGARLLL